MKFINKKIVFAVTALFIVGLMPLFQSCSNEDVEITGNTKYNLARQEMIRLMNEQLFLKGNLYELHMTLKEAKEAGISDEEYYKMTEVVNSTNNKINEIRKIRKISLKLIDPHNIKIDLKVNLKTTRLKIKSELVTNCFTMSCSPVQSQSGLYSSDLSSISLTGTSDYMITIFSGKVETGFGNSYFAFQPSSGVNSVGLPANPCGFKVYCSTNSDAGNTLQVCYTNIIYTN